MTPPRKILIAGGSGHPATRDAILSKTALAVNKDIRNLLVDHVAIKRVHAVRDLAHLPQHAGGYTVSGRDRPSTGEEVLLKLNSKFPVAKKLYGITKLGIFDALARGEEKENSRIDILVEFSSSRDNLKNFCELCTFIEELIGKKVWLVTTRVLAEHPPLMKEPVPFDAEGKDVVCLEKIREEVRTLLEYQEKANFRQFALEEPSSQKVTLSLDMIGRCAVLVSPGEKIRNPGIPWNLLICLHNRLIHPYYGPDLKIAWNAVTDLLPPLVPDLDAIIGTLQNNSPVSRVLPQDPRERTE
jgi:uncharacterized protein with HEPN domain/predicted nucleotidyltransferase